VTTAFLVPEGAQANRGSSAPSMARYRLSRSRSAAHPTYLGRSLDATRAILACTARWAHFQPDTRPACTIHLCISGLCAFSRVSSRSGPVPCFRVAAAGRSPRRRGRQRVRRQRQFRMKARGPGPSPVPRRTYARVVLYHFEFHGETCWEPFGSGEGTGVDPIATAMVDLTAVCGDPLPDGEYRCIAATSESPRWESVWLGAGGRTIHTEAVAAVRRP
jgi:hypothetical protein